MIKLFHVSKKPRLTTLIPSVPNHFMTSHLLEEGATKRVSFAPSIQQCLRAVQSQPGDTFYVYTPTAIDKKYLKRASIYDVPDARLTGEYWYTKPVNVKLYAVVKSGKLYNASVFRVGGIEARRPKDRPLFAISNDREYELLKRYNKNGRELTIKVALRNRAPVTDEDWRRRFDMKRAKKRLDYDDYYEDDSLRERLRRFGRNLRGEDEDEEDDRRGGNRKNKIRKLLARELIRKLLF